MEVCKLAAFYELRYSDKVLHDKIPTTSGFLGDGSQLGCSESIVGSPVEVSVCQVRAGCMHTDKVVA